MAFREERKVVKEVILGVGMVDPLDRDVGVVEEAFAKLGCEAVLDEGVGKGGRDDLVGQALEERKRSVEEGFAVHFDPLEAESPDVFDNANPDAALGGFVEGGPDAGSDLVGTPDIHVDFDGGSGGGDLGEDGFESGPGGTGCGVGIVEEADTHGVRQEEVGVWAPSGQRANLHRGCNDLSSERAGSVNNSLCGK